MTEELKKAHKGKSKDAIEEPAVGETDESVADSADRPHAKIARIINKKKWTAARQRRKQVRVQREGDVSSIIKPTIMARAARVQLAGKRFSKLALAKLREEIANDILRVMSDGVYLAGPKIMTPTMLAKAVIMRDGASSGLPSAMLHSRETSMIEGL